jgi:hypothetical protein
MNNEREVQDETMEQARRRLERINQDMIIRVQADRWKEQTELSDWIKSHKSSFKIAGEYQRLHENRAKELVQIVLLVGVTSVLFNLLASFLFGLFTGSGEIGLNILGVLSTSIIASAILIGFAYYFVREPLPIEITFLIPIP